MRNSFLFGSAILALSGMSLQALAADDYPASASTDIYDQSPWENEGVLRLFANAWNNGQRNYPTKDELKAIGLTMDLEFVRSHTRYRNIVKDASKDVVSDINHDRLLWCNLPAGYGKSLGGYPSTQFDQDVFSLWNYTSLFGSWNYGFLLAPGSWVDAAHKNGTRIYGGIKFFESWNNDGSEGTFQQFIQTKAKSGSEYTYEYSRAFVNAAAFFGNDGYNYNQEGTTYRTDDWKNFHAEVRQIARDLNIDGFGIGQYTMNPSLSQSMAPYLYGDKDKGIIFDCFLNYSGNKFAYSSVESSLKVADNLDLGYDNLFQGHLLVGLSSDYWTQMNTEARKPMNICIWGEHDQSRFYQFRIGDSPTNIQSNYQLLLEKAFSGANRNPLNRPEINNAWGAFQVADPSQADEQLNNSPGFASMFPERTAINGSLPFQTYFSLGNGENYFYKGKVTGGSWYNMSQQDIVPTYRWLVTKKNDMKAYANDIDVRFTHEDAYIGGSSLQLTGSTSAGNDIVLYRTNLTVSEGNPKATVALKGFKAGDTNVSVIVKLKNGTNWLETKTNALKSAAWEEQVLDLNGVQKGDVIEYIGLRVNSAANGYKVLVGELKLSDDRLLQQAVIDPSSVMVEVKEETPSSLSVKIGYEPDYKGYTTSIDKFGMVYNDEVNIDHFEILVKDSKDGKAREVARTSQWAAYVGKIALDQSATDAYVGVRSVSVDLRCMSPVVWVQIPRYQGALPEVAEEDPYGKSWMSSIGNGTLANCITHIWAEEVKTEGATTNLNYKVNANPLLGNSEEQYYFAKDHQLVIRQGQDIKLTFKGHESGTSECIHYDFINAYIDYDGNYSFLDSAEETLGKFGNLNAGTPAITEPGLTIEFKVPADAHRGESRLRIVASDAWTPHPGPTGGTVKGYTIDFPVLIEGDNTNDRGPAETYKDLRDQGEADEPEFINEGVNADDASVDTILSADGSFSSVVLNGDIATFTNTDEAWFYNIDGKVALYVADAKVPVSVSELPAGIYVVKMLNGKVVRSAKVVKK